MLDNPTLPATPSTAPSSQKNEEVAGGGAGPASAGLQEEDRAGLEEGYRNGAGNRWPREETLALLKIRSDMDAEFKEATVKVPLWAVVSQKMGELGYNRSDRKCREKFENIYKYNRRSKESGRSSTGKNYRFFEQLEALDQQHSEHFPPAAERVRTPIAEKVTSPTTVAYSNAMPCSSVQHPVSSFVYNSSSATSSSSKESQGIINKKRKRLTEFFERMMNEVIHKQENLQKQFVEVLEKYEQDRMARQEAWKRQELDRIKREKELLVQERSIAAAKDAAVLAFLKKFSEQGGTTQFPAQEFSVQLPHQPSSVQFPEQPSSGQFTAHPLPVHLPAQPLPIQLPAQPQAVQLPAQPLPVQTHLNSKGNLEKNDHSNLVQSSDKQEIYSVRSPMNVSSSRWPKEEVEALVRIRSDFDSKYQENGPKGPLWDEISAAMEKLGYDRNAKRCKEKWENINKYYRRIKESSKTRSEGSKTCAYVCLLDDLYNKKTNRVDNQFNKVDNQLNSNDELKPEELLMHMMGRQEEEQYQQKSVTEGSDGENSDHTHGGNVNVGGDAYRLNMAGNPSSMEADNSSMAIVS